MRCRDLLNDQEYIREKNILTSKINGLKAKQRETENRAERWLGLAEKAFDFAAFAREAFENGDKETKRDIPVVDEVRTTIYSLSRETMIPRVLQTAEIMNYP